MPLYTYLNLTTGKTEEIARTIAERDTLGGYERIFEAPAAVKVINPSAGELSLQAKQVLAGYRSLEDKQQFRSQFSASKIKDAWNAPEPVETTKENE